MKQRLVSLVSTLVLSYLGLCAVLFLLQRSLLYYRTPETESKHANSISLPSNGETIKLWHINNNSPQAIIYFGGNAEDVALNILDYSLLFRNHSVYLVNYRGYGGSTGSPAETGLYLDALAIYDHLQEKHSSISVIGRSLGSGVASYLAAERTVDKLVLITPFDSIENVAKSKFPIFPISLLLKDKYKSIDRVDKIKASTLILIAERDEVIPRRSSKKLAAAFPASQVTITTVENAMHNDIHFSPAYTAALAEFVNR